VIDTLAKHQRIYHASCFCASENDVYGKSASKLYVLT
jgi:hypothetical protein